MRQLSITVLILLALLLAACAREAAYVDHEFGMATRDAFDRQIIHKDYAHAGKPVEGLAGIHAEPIMNTYQKTFSEGFTREDIDTAQLGLETE